MFQNLGEQDTTELIWSLLREPGEADPNRDRYLNLMKLSLTDLLYEDVGAVAIGERGVASDDEERTEP